MIALQVPLIGYVAYQAWLSHVYSRWWASGEGEDEQLEAGPSGINLAAFKDWIKGSEELTEGEITIGLLRAGLNTPFRQYWYTKGKSEFPSLQFTEANTLMVQEWLRRAMKEDKIPDWIVAQQLPLLAANIITPNRSEVRAKQALKKPAVQRRVRAMREATSLSLWDRFYGVVLPTVK